MTTEGLRVLYIDLSKGDIHLEERRDLVSYIGGVSVATQLLKEYVNFQRPALDPSQPIIFAKGPMNTIFPVVTKVCSMFKSPVTEELGESYAGLRFGLAMGMAGLDAIVITGRAKAPVYLHINEEIVEVKDAKPLWFLNNDETNRLLHDTAGHRGLRSILTIGLGGVKQVRFANVTVDSYRHFGRLGLGCLMGSKNIKALVVEGKRNQPLEDLKPYKKAYEEIYKKVTEKDTMEKYHNLGTSGNVRLLNELGALPSYNFQKTFHDKAIHISGEGFAEKSLVKKVACSGCPIGCIHLGLLRKEFQHPNEYEMAMVSYDHELIYSLGAMLGVWSQNGLLKLIETVELLGLDAIATGVLLSWMTEAYSKSIITDEETIIPPKFGDVEGYIDIIHHIPMKTNEFYDAASRGTHYVSEKYGGKDFAMILGKNEVAGYHTGYGNIIGQMVGARHSHLDNAGYAIDQENHNFSREEIVHKLIEEEIDRNILNSMVICLFARKVYDLSTITKALKSIGYDLDENDLKKLGWETYFEKIRIKKKMGFNYEDLSIPDRFFETTSCSRKLEKHEAEKILFLYNKEIEKKFSNT